MKRESPVWNRLHEWMNFTNKTFSTIKIGSIMASHEKKLLCGTDYMNKCIDLGSDSGTGSKYIKYSI